MNNMSTFILFVLMACTVYAQSPFLSLPYFSNQQVLPTKQNVPVLHQNADQHVPHRDVIMSVLLRELKETKIAVENVKKEMKAEISNLKIDIVNRDQEMTHLKSKVAQLEKSAEEKIEEDNSKMNETKTQTENLSKEFDPFAYDSSKDGVTRFCNCGLIQQTTDKLRKDLTATNVKFTGITDKTIKDLADAITKFDGPNQAIKDLDDIVVKLAAITDDNIADLAATKVTFKGITDDITADLTATKSTIKDTTDGIADDLVSATSTIKTTTDGITADLLSAKSTIKETTDSIAADLTSAISAIKITTDKIVADLVDAKLEIQITTNGIAANLAEAKTEIQTTTNNLNRDLYATIIDLSTLTTDFKESIRPKTIGRHPVSCEDLNELGYKKSGIFTVMGNKQMESVYCDFTKSDSDTDFQKLIGIIALKTNRVSFNAKLSTTYDKALSPVPFDVIVTNVGNAMSATNGIFTAPTAGSYFFACSGVGANMIGALVWFEKKTDTVDWVRIGSGYGHRDGIQTFALQSILSLGKGDQIRVFLRIGSIYEEADLGLGSFIGLLLEEELV